MRPSSIAVLALVSGLLAGLGCAGKHAGSGPTPGATNIKGSGPPGSSCRPAPFEVAMLESLTDAGLEDGGLFSPDCAQVCHPEPAGGPYATPLCTAQELDGGTLLGDGGSLPGQAGGRPFQVICQYESTCS